MGWGCNKHEWDAGSEAWEEFKDALIAKEQRAKFPTWGRHGEICPKCFVRYREAFNLLTELHYLAAIPSSHSERAKNIVEKLEDDE